MNVALHWADVVVSQFWALVAVADEVAVLPVITTRGLVAVAVGVTAPLGPVPVIVIAS